MVEGLQPSHLQPKTSSCSPHFLFPTGGTLKWFYLPMAPETQEVAPCWKAQWASQDADVDAHVQGIHTTPAAPVDLAMGMQQLSAKERHCSAELEPWLVHPGPSAPAGDLHCTQSLDFLRTRQTGFAKKEIPVKPSRFLVFSGPVFWKQSFVTRLNRWSLLPEETWAELYMWWGLGRIILKVKSSDTDVPRSGKLPWRAQQRAFDGTLGS